MLKVWTLTSKQRQNGKNCPNIMDSTVGVHALKSSFHLGEHCFVVQSTHTQRYHQHKNQDYEN